MIGRDAESSTGAQSCSGILSPSVSQKTMSQNKDDRPRPPEIVREEIRLLDSVQQSVSSSLEPAGLPDYDAAMIRLRDQLTQEKLEDDRAMYAEQMARVAALAQTLHRYDPALPDVANPYFAHLRLVTDEGDRRDIMLGKTTYLKDGVRIVDWRDAPISQIFYRYEEGEVFAEEIAERLMSGEVEARRTVTISGGQLTRVATPSEAFLRADDRWIEHGPDQRTRLYGGEGTASRPETTRPLLGAPDGSTLHRLDKHLPEIAALLDSEQFDLLTSSPSSLLVVSGGAGSGKTTVALHRLAYLSFENPKRFQPKRMLVLVFGLALARYIRKVLPALGVENVEVQTLERWARAQFRKHFQKLKQNVCTTTPACVVRFKTHRILIPMLEQAAQASPKADPGALFDELFTDKTWISQGVKTHAPGSFSAGEIDEIYRWGVSQQFSRETDTATSGGEPPSYDEEDHVILLRLYQLLSGRLRRRGKRPLTYDHVMVDEVQDFSPLELMVLLQTVRDNSATLAGDPAQKITDNDFSDWSEVLELVGESHVRISPLRIGYRSTREIMDFARDVLGDLLPDEPFTSIRSGAGVEWFQFPGPGEAIIFLGDALHDLVVREPDASVAVLARTPGQADEAYAGLRLGNLPGLARIRDQEFSFAPGIDVTDVAQTKGLEFDYVVLLNLDRSSYPDAIPDRRILHVGATRAIHQLWLISWGTPSPLLPDWLKPHREDRQPP